jgi:hypothetical protein
MFFDSKYRAAAESLAEQLSEVRDELELERTKRISNDALVGALKEERDRLIVQCDKAEAARDAAIKLVNETNAKLLQTVNPAEKLIDFARLREAQREGTAPPNLVPVMAKHHRPKNEADKLLEDMLALQRDQRIRKMAAGKVQIVATPQVPS